MSEVMDFLLTRRSRPAKLLSSPGPDRATLEKILTAGGRVPDHGKLEPWRFVVFEGAALSRISADIICRAEEIGEDGAKASSPFDLAPVCIMVVGSTVEGTKIPEYEQVLSAGCAAMSVLNAALASGWGANWLTAWIATDKPLLKDTFGLTGDEWVAGFIHIGTCQNPPPERPRPDMDRKVDWVDQ